MSYWQVSIAFVIIIIIRADLQEYWENISLKRSPWWNLYRVNRLYIKDKQQ